MRVLILTGFFPPHSVGGHEIHCQEMSAKLERLGFQIRVLTSRFGVARPVQDGNVRRFLHIYGYGHGTNGHQSFLHRAWWDWQDCLALVREVREFRPDVVFLWVTHCLTRSLMSVLADLDLPVVWQDGGDCLLKIVRRRGPWLVLCEQEPGSKVKKMIHRSLLAASRWLTRGVLPTALVFPRNLTVYQCSEHSYRLVEAQRTIPVRKHLFIHPGVDLDIFRMAPRQSAFPAEVTLLCPGRITECKGQIDAVRAMGLVRSAKQAWKVRLIFTGQAQDMDYEKTVRDEVSRLGLESAVEFRGMVPRASLCSLYHSGDIVLFTSTYEEPFGTVIAEGKACGRPVVASNVGGAREQISHRETAMVYKAGDPREMANSIMELCEDLTLYDHIAKRGRSDVEEHFSMDHIAIEVARLLKAAANGTP